MALPNPAFIQCTAATCTQQDCCRQSCSQYQQNKVCAGATCTQDECCKPAWNSWGTPSQCIANDGICGNGVQKRVRSCVGGSSTNPCSGPSEETSNCHIPCQQKELYCWWHGDPHILPFVSTAIVTRAHDCGACGYDSNPQWQPYFHATKAGVG